MLLATADVTIYSEKRSENFAGNPRTEQIYFALDQPNVAERKIDIRLPPKMMVHHVVAVWYQPIEGLDQLDGFSIIDVVDNNQSHFANDYLQMTLMASSMAGLSKAVKIRIFVLYVGNVPTVRR
jgi:hypothetical protein